MSGRMSRRERRTKDAELVQWRLRRAGSTQTPDDLRTPELERIDGAEAKVTSTLAGLYERQQQRADFYATHPEAARRPDRVGRRSPGARGRRGRTDHGNPRWSEVGWVIRRRCGTS